MRSLRFGIKPSHRERRDEKRKNKSGFLTFFIEKNKKRCIMIIRTDTRIG